MPDANAYGFRIRPHGEAWRWDAIDAKGQVLDSGAAPTKAVAAALVIRALARGAGPQAAAS